MCRLSSFPHNEDAFVRYCARYPLVHARVNACLSTLEQVMESESFPDLVAGRDAALHLAMIAREGGFLLLADFFSMQHDRFCRALLPFFVDRLSSPLMSRVSDRTNERCLSGSGAVPGPAHPKEI